MKPVSNYWHGNLWTKQKKKTFYMWVSSLLVIVACAIACALTDDIYLKLGLIVMILVAGYMLYGARGYYEDYRYLEAALFHLEQSPKQSLTQLAQKLKIGRKELISAIQTAIKCGALKGIYIDEEADHLYEQ